ncbi:demethoxyubiquinone hydroxylase family protein [Undibacterium terreum]|uniref:5-demethoxyubiquinone hydroxylase, mitochondrial n=1 Tax=Undibacterium terreum TaxID=1224302 RepID=A0A916XFI8_9BURK|nr:demethoxyubiquinone hydroxylase family protein [Undibacterium terreum]GGC68141.1 5-demethoxyubiquinone hydroxylase, mitochondrial [Undibacterium terreum]
MIPAVSMNAHTTLGGRILKVNHAGEQGAVNIYAGQIFMARLTTPTLVPELREFKSHEEAHRAIFAAELKRRGLPRCRSYWLCAAGGYTLGLLTGLFGKRAIAATTVAVESVVLKHLEHQLTDLHGKDQDAVAAISAIVVEERLHHDQSASYLPTGNLWSKLITPVVALSTEAVIWMGMNI